jgi:small subunit ribosomal protein S5
LEKVKLNPDDVRYEKLVGTNRVAKVVKGGRNFSFNAIIVIGNQEGIVGVGSGKAKEITDAIRKAREKAIKNVFRIPIVNGTIPHEVNAKYGPSKLLVKPASQGTGLIAGGTPRAIFEAAGIRNILAKSMGSNTPCNLVKATIIAMKELRTLSQVAKLRGKTFEYLSGTEEPK